MKNRMGIGRCALALCLLVAGPVAAQTDTVIKSERQTAPSLTEGERAAFYESFDHVWETVRTKHFDEELNGVDWDATRDELRPRIGEATTRAEARRPIEAMLGRLGQSHFQIISSEAYDKLDAEQSVKDITKPGWTGIEARLVGDEIVVTEVRDDSPAMEAGVRTGWAILSIDGRGLDRVVEIANEAQTIQRPASTAAMIMRGRLLGNVGDTMEFRFEDLGGGVHERGITLVEAPGELASIGELPPSPVTIESRTLEAGVGYFRLSIFLDPPRVLREFKAFLETHEDAPGIVIDLRGNPGGIIVMASAMMNRMVSERGLKMGALKMRDESRGSFEIPVVINPWSKTYDGKVAVLIDELSISNSEIFAAGLKDIGRARVFGVPTAGLVLPSTVERLPNGDGFQYAFASYTSSGGGALEGVGAIPDEHIELTREALVEGDPVLDAARAWASE